MSVRVLVDARVTCSSWRRRAKDPGYLKLGAVVSLSLH